MPASGTMLAEDVGGSKIQAAGLSTSQDVVTATGSSTASTVLTLGTRLVRVVCTTDTRVAIGVSPVAATTGAYVPAYVVEYFKVDGLGSGAGLGVVAVAGRAVSAAGIMNVTEMI